MAKTVFFSFPFSGHVNPSLPLVKARVDHGEEVVYYANPAFAERVEQAGARCRVYRSAAMNGIEELVRAPGFPGPVLLRLARAAEELLGENLEEVRRERPDYIIYDNSAHWGKFTADVLVVPAVTMVPILALNRAVTAWRHKVNAIVRPERRGEVLVRLVHALRAACVGLRIRRRLRRAFGVSYALREFLDCFDAPLNIVLTSRYFQPCGDSFDDRFVFVGPPISNEKEAVSVPAEPGTPESSVYVSMGTAFNRNAEFFRNCFEALGAFDGRVVLSTGGGLQPEELGPTPPNFLIHRFVPEPEELDVLRNAEVVITNGGFSTLHKCLYHGVPVVVIPQIDEQARNARRVEELQAGVYLDRSTVSAASLAGAFKRVRADETFRCNSRRIGESLRSSGGMQRAVASILSFTRCGQGTVDNGRYPRRAGSNRSLGT